MTRTVHFGVAGLRTACGRPEVQNTTLDRSEVSCSPCRGTVKFATDFYTRTTSVVPRSMNTKQGRSRRHREGARP